MIVFDQECSEGSMTVAFPNVPTAESAASHQVNHLYY